MFRSGRRTPGLAVRHRHRGQVILFLIMAVTILSFVLLWNIDLHRLISLKTRSQHGGDAAALAAARWQATTLNLIGELNLMQALALAAGDEEASAMIPRIQARLSFSGPMAGLVAAQVAAKNNRLYEVSDFSEMIGEHAQTVRSIYTEQMGENMLFPEPYPGAWQDYAAMLETAAGHGIAAAPDNARFLTDRIGGRHTLYQQSFYDAVAGRNWCWFFNNAMRLLEEYNDFNWWPDLPAIQPTVSHNSEIFSLGLRPLTARLSSFTVVESLEEAAAGQEIPLDGLDQLEPEHDWATWYCYDDGDWGEWSQMSVTGSEPFPLTGPVRPQFDYQGADAVVRVLSETDRFFADPGQPDATRAINWTAAAKPFGWLENDLRPNAYGLVLPAFRQVRLIPVDASSAPEGGAFDLGWRRHVEEHLPLYIQFGPQDLPGCWYCIQLRTWENPEFRQQGLAWLELFSHRCLQPDRPGGGGGGGGGGGTRSGGRRRGH